MKDMDWRERREQVDLTLSELARRTGINKGELSRIERRYVVPTPHQAELILRELREATR